MGSWNPGRAICPPTYIQLQLKRQFSSTSAGKFNRNNSKLCQNCSWGAFSFRSGNLCFHFSFKTKNVPFELVQSSVRKTVPRCGRPEVHFIIMKNFSRHSHKMAFKVYMPMYKFVVVASMIDHKVPISEESNW